MRHDPRKTFVAGNDKHSKGHKCPECFCPMLPFEGGLACKSFGCVLKACGGSMKAAALRYFDLHQMPADAEAREGQEIGERVRRERGRQDKRNRLQY